MLVNPDTSQKKEVRSRQRASTSCTECRRRKQKCNQAKDRPCNNCSRRYPPVPCIYEGLKKPSKYVQTVTQPKTEESDAESSTVLATIEESEPNEKLKFHLLTPGVISRGSSWDGRSWGSPGRERSTSPDGSSDISPNIRLLQYYPYTEQYEKSYNALPKMRVGSPGLEPLHSLPIEPSMRNAQLFHFFLQRLAPFMSSVDGQDPPAEFNDKYIPFMVQSPIVCYIGILTSSYFQAISRRIDMDKSVDVVTAKVKLITLINEHIATHRGCVSDEAIASVMSLAYNELIYADERSVLAHMNGLAEMVRTRGGLENIQFKILRTMLIRTDYHVAFTFERGLFLSQECKEPVPVFDEYPLALESPLLQSPKRFVDTAKELDISKETARVLDDMRFLTTSILNLSQNALSKQEKAKFLATAQWIHERLSSTIDTKAESDFVYLSCRTTAIIYSSAILTRTPLSKVCTAELLQQLWMTLWRVPLSRWKKLPGIFSWILAVVHPFARNRPEARFLKGLLPPALLEIQYLDNDVGMWRATMDGLLLVQKWLNGDNPEVPDPSGKSPEPIQPESLPDWAITRNSELIYDSDESDEQ